MSARAKNEFEPDYAIHPGEILEETLEARQIKKVELAERAGLSVKTVSYIIAGKAQVTPETAIRLERALGVSASVWNNLNATFCLHEAEETARIALERDVEWAKEFPLKQLADRGVIPKTADATQNVQALLRFFGVASMEGWQQQCERRQLQLRHSPAFKSSPESISAWLQIGTLRAEAIQCQPYSKATFLAALVGIRKLTVEDPEVFAPRMRTLCAKAGVALVFVSELRDTHLSGATRWLTKDKALIILSLRHKSDDHFWFSFFHEAAHVLRHRKRPVFVDGRLYKGGTGSAKEEDDANGFARDLLIPPDEYGSFISSEGYRSQPGVESFARRLAIAPGIVVGRLQHDEHIKYSRYRGLKRKFVLVECAA